MEWVKSLRVGDRVFLANIWSSRQHTLTTVEKIGRKWITFSSGLRYNIETNRIEDYSYRLWRSMEEYQKDLNIQRRWRYIGDQLSNETKRNELHLDEDKLEQIERILACGQKKS